MVRSWIFRKQGKRLTEEAKEKAKEDVLQYIHQHDRGS